MVRAQTMEFKMASQAASAAAWKTGFNSPSGMMVWEIRPDSAGMRFYVVKPIITSPLPWPV